MNGSIKNMLVGIFILSSITLLISVVLFLKPSVGDGKQVLCVRFSDINNVNIGTRVLFAGRPVGEVKLIEEIRDARQEPTDELGRVYFYQLTLHVDSKVRVYNTDEISIQTSGLLGEKSIAITPKSPPIGITPKRVESQPIYANSVDILQNALLDFSELAGSMEETFQQFGYWFKNNSDEISKTINNAKGALKQIDEAVATYNNRQIINDVQKGLEKFSGTLDQVQVAFHELEEKQTFSNAGITIENLKKASHCVEELSFNLSHGKGTLGRLLVDDDSYLQINAILTKANNLMNDLNHYGLLFHLNKQWQRTRLQKVNLLNALDTPASFRCYFQSEVDSINLAMSRLSMLIEKAEQAIEKKQILQSEEFKKDFADLLRISDRLSDNLRLYNQQLNEATGE